MFEHKKEFLGIKVSIYAIMVAMFSMTLAFVLVESRAMKQQVKADQQIDKLYTEIGVLNEEKMYLYQEVLENQKHLKTLYSTLYEISANVNNYGDDKYLLEEALENAQKSLSTQNQNILSLIDSNLVGLNNMALPDVDGVLDILVVGMHGHLTDSIMIARVLEDQQKVVLINIPRDLYYQGRKINEIYSAYGEEKLREAVMNITGMVIEKYAVVNLNSFLEAYDLLFPDGLVVEVEKDIYDNAYPDGNYGYIVFSLSAGKQTLNSSAALKYARTRHGDSDFERAKRQQNLVKYAVEDLKSRDILASLDDALLLVNELNEAIDTDIGVFEILQYLQDYSSFELQGGNVIDNQTKEFIDNSGQQVNEALMVSTTNYNGQYILIPTQGSFEQVWAYVKWLGI